ncbi:MAG TPA: acetate/propionate family kinase [Bryobacteraceae bacterium]
MSDSFILVINSGSSSLKFGLYARRENQERLVVDGSAENIGKPGGRIALRDSSDRVLGSESRDFASQSDALEHAAGLLAQFAPEKPCAIGHRVVHGGPQLVTHQRITPAMIEELRGCVHFAPLHIPTALELIEKAQRAYPQIPQFACFDTAFHRSLPESAARFALPGEFFDQGIRRYGFHGLSYESIVYQLGAKLPSRTVMAHLGSGASLAAVKEGKSVDTTMALTPTAGIPMATRSGDLDPGILLYLLRVKKMNADSLETLLNHDAGLRGLSGGESDMRKLESAAQGGDKKAQLAIDVFCMSVRKTIAAYAAVLQGLDLLVFAGGIGEHSAYIRGKICEGLQFLGIPPDEGSGSVRVQVVPSQEDLQIARHCRGLMGAA